MPILCGKWIPGYFEVLWTQCYWISFCVFVFIFCSTHVVGVRTCLKVLFSQFVFIILFIVLPFAACWVHTCYSAFKIHSRETCVLNSAAICCRKRTQPFPDTSVWERHVFYLCYRYCISCVSLYLFPFCLLWFHKETTLLRVWANTTFLVSLAIVFIWSLFDKTGMQRVWHYPSQSAEPWIQSFTSYRSCLDLYGDQGVACGLFVTFWLRTLCGLLVLLCLKAHTHQDLKQAVRMQRKHSIVSIDRKKQNNSYDTIGHNKLPFFSGI